jgi:hypothetical protein
MNDNNVEAAIKQALDDEKWEIEKKRRDDGGEERVGDSTRTKKKGKEYFQISQSDEM